MGEGVACATTEFRSAGDVLQIGRTRTESARRGHGLVEFGVYATVGADERRQRVCVRRLELVEFAELDEEARQFVSLRKLFEDGAVCGDLTRCGLASGADVERFDDFADLLRRV